MVPSYGMQKDSVKKNLMYATPLLDFINMTFHTVIPCDYLVMLHTRIVWKNQSKGSREQNFLYVRCCLDLMHIVIKFIKIFCTVI